MTTMRRLHGLMREKDRAAREAERGMTLLEIMVVITIIGVVMATVTMAVLPQLDKAKVDTTITSMRGIQSGLKLYYARHGKYPDTSQGLQILITEKLLEPPVKDGWGNDFVYTAEGSSYKLVSYGSDNQPGGDGAGADISSDVLAATGKK